MEGFIWGASEVLPPDLPKNASKKVDVIEYDDLGMEAIRKIEVENFPAFIITDDKGNDFFIGDGAA